jgi:UDP-N-acetylglucosamine:LPS N-acetylglucosamine transferase
MAQKSLLLVASPGGHLTELLELSEAFAGQTVHTLTYREAVAGDLPNAHFISNLAQKPWTFFNSIFHLLALLHNIKPVCLVSTGGELAIPAFIIGKLFFRTRLVFIECSAQVRTPSLTGRLLYPFCDLFLVQWKPLL